jgi:hypothetical protein
LLLVLTEFFIPERISRVAWSTCWR